MRSLCLLIGILFLAAYAVGEKPAGEDGGLSPHGEEMEPEMEMEAEAAGEADQLTLNEDAPQDFLLASTILGKNRKVTYERCSCRKTCRKDNRKGRCQRNFIGYICCIP